MTNDILLKKDVGIPRVPSPNGLSQAFNLVVRAVAAAIGFLLASAGLFLIGSGLYLTWLHSNAADIAPVVFGFICLIFAIVFFEQDGRSGFLPATQEANLLHNIRKFSLWSSWLLTRLVFFILVLTCLASVSASLLGVFYPSSARVADPTIAFFFALVAGFCTYRFIPYLRQPAPKNRKPVLPLQTTPSRRPQLPFNRQTIHENIWGRALRLAAGLGLLILACYMFVTIPDPKLEAILLPVAAGLGLVAYGIHGFMTHGRLIEYDSEGVRLGGAWTKRSYAWADVRSVQFVKETTYLMYAVPLKSEHLIVFRVAGGLFGTRKIAVRTKHTDLELSELALHVKAMALQVAIANE